MPTGTCNISVTAPLPGDMFVDTFTGGVRAGTQNGISYGEHTQHPELSPPSTLGVTADGGSPTGFSLDAAFGTPSSPITAGAFTIEEHFNLPNMPEIFIEQTLIVDANFFLRNTHTSNNDKILRLWDTNYSGSKVHVGMSLRSRSAHQDAITPMGTGDGSGSLEVEYNKYGFVGSGNWGQGPYTAVLHPNTEVKIGFYCHVASAEGVPDGIIKAWVNDVLVYSHTDLALCLAGGTVNLFQHGFLFGPANSGFGINALAPVNPTHVRVRKWRVRATAPY